VWLAHLGQWDPAAAELGIHRHTLRNRMNTAADILGRSLDSPGTRSELWLAMELTSEAAPTDDGHRGRSTISTVSSGSSNRRPQRLSGQHSSSTPSAGR